MRKNLTIGLFVSFALVGVSVGSFLLSERSPVSTLKASKEISLSLNGHVLAAEVADTASERLQGLSDRAELAPGKGMFFVFPESDYQGIWMKDMHFPIDILWLDQSYHVVSLMTNVSPGTYPTIFKPAVPAEYVLETNAGFVKQVGLHLGDQVQKIRE
ncbi:MAG TPA: DUF192 domain-containing protein [Candidatus Paceibacterota bacterium]|nr:DUF192 domain-containing protein [Candidatus Paceibacterota bacterium]